MQLETQEPADDGRVTLTIKADAQDLARAIDGVYRDLARRVAIPGFRKGKAPRALLEQQVDAEQAKKMALEDLAPQAVIEGLSQAQIEPFNAPKLDKAQLEEDGSATFVAVVTPRPVVELGEYKGLEGTRPAIEVTDEQVEAQIAATRERYARWEPVTERPAEAGDLALVDYDLEVDGQVIEGQGARGYPSQIGGDTLFPELDQKLPGLKPGEQARIPATVPDDHPDEGVRGKPGEFVVTVREIKQRVVPELTDEMAREAHQIDTVEDLRKVTHGVLEHVARQDLEDQLRKELLDKVVATSKVSVPSALTELEAQARLDRLEGDLRARGRRLEEYLQERGMTQERWLRNEEMQARLDLERMLVLEEISRREGIAVSEDEISGIIATHATRTGTTPARVRDRMEERDLDRLTNQLHHDKVLQFLVDNAKITDEGAADAAAEESAPEPTEEQP